MQSTTGSLYIYHVFVVAARTMTAGSLHKYQMYHVVVVVVVVFTPCTSWSRRYTSSVVDVGVVVPGVIGECAAASGVAASAHLLADLDQLN